VTISDVNWSLLAFSGYPSFSKIVASIALTFFAFLGFGVMTFTVANLRDPERELPRAVALALGLTTATYVLIAIGVFGTLTVDQAIGYGETAIAEAARPVQPVHGQRSAAAGDDQPPARAGAGAAAQ